MSGAAYKDTSSSTSSSPIISAKKHQKALQSILEEFICPITLTLPFEPVMAEDGRVYERKAIEKHIQQAQQSGVPLKSPISNEYMGPNLFPSPQIKNAIETAIDSGGEMGGDHVKLWKEQRALKQELEELKRRALTGDVTAAMRLAFRYAHGEMDEVSDQDWDEAGKWWKVASDAGDIPGMAMYGKYLSTRPNRSPMERAHGFALLSAAATSGNAWACLTLGQEYAKGEYVAQSDIDAMRWLQKGLDCDIGANR
ncbi:MAG: hypothetical protein SGARI_003497 [Bacillariaceae sp.]